MLVSKFSVYDHIQHPVFVLVQNQDHIPIFTFVNKSTLEFANLPETDFIGKSCRDVYSSPYGDVVYAHHCCAFETGETNTYRISVPSNNSHMSQLQTTLTPVLDEKGIVTHVVGMAIDVTDNTAVQKLQTHATALGQDLQHSLVPQVELSSEIEDFVSLAAHDLRTPILNVGMIANLLRDELTDSSESKLELVDALEDISTRTLSLISDVLAHASATSTQADVVHFEFSEMVKSIVAMLDPMKRCDCTATACHITGDRAATQIILRNLIDNALKHALDKHSDDALKLTITAQPDTKHGFFRINVTDNGRGISPERIKYLNSGEFKSDTGFGIVGARRLLHARGGCITAANAKDSGALISFSLPGTFTAAD